MNAVQGDKNNEELNRIILLLGKRGKESLRWENHEGNFWNIMFNPSLEIWNNISGTCLILQPYGSTAEDLKSEEADDIGDVDIMIFPDSDNLLIHDEMIEYLPDHPLHVRIKGADHPVLKFCCVKDTGYLSTSALKTSNELIYGDLGDALGFTFELISRETPSFTLPLACHLENSGSSPALKVNFALASEDLATSPSIHSSTRERQENSFRFQENVMNEQVREEVENDDDKSEEKREGDRSLTAIELEGKRQLFAQKMEPCSSKGLMRTFGRDREKLETEKQLKKIHEEKAAMHLFKYMFGKEDDGNEESFKESKLIETEIEKECFSKNTVLSGIDFVPALMSRGWPKVAKTWIELERKWPSANVVRQIITEGFHLVAKAPKKSGNPDYDFRISFSHAEYLLSKEMNDIQRECYRCLKKFHRAYLSRPKGLVTFHLKNVFLLTIEETGVHMWTESNRAECMMKLLWNLFEVLTKRHLPHFFVRSYNLFCVDYIEEPYIMESLVEKVKEIMQYPTKFAKELVEHQ